MKLLRRSLIPTLERLSCKDFTRLINDLEEEAPTQVGKGAVIKKGVSEELDEVRSLAFESDKALEEIRLREVKRTEISSLKIGFNNVFGYYLEVEHKEKVPDEWIRKKTLTQAEGISRRVESIRGKILDAKKELLLLNIDFTTTSLLRPTKLLNSLVMQGLWVN